jgi:glycosyltransferase involved in cell wall biosynthesis
VKFALAHDYLVQRGGAERVALTWQKQFPEANLHTLVYDAPRTFRDFDGDRIIPWADSRLKKAILHDPARALPLLPSIARAVKITDADLVLTSSSGFAHLFDTHMPAIVYCHSPARWLWARKDYEKGLSGPKTMALRMVAPYLRHRDLRGASQASCYVANSTVTALRIKEAYGLTAPVVFPPVSRVSTEAVRPTRPLPAEFLLCVSRPRGYKNIPLSVAVARQVGVPIVVVGASSLEEVGVVENEGPVIAMGRVSDAELVWLYRNALGLICFAHEDFGLTPVEAAIEGTPTLAVADSGYLDTIVHGVNGILAPNRNIDDVVISAKEFLSTTWDRASIMESAERFSVQRHITSLRALAQKLLGEPTSTGEVPSQLPT